MNDEQIHFNENLYENEIIQNDIWNVMKSLCENVL